MVGLDDVRERVREGIAAHGATSVLLAIHAELTDLWESASADPDARELADRLIAACGCVRAAALCGTFPFGPGPTADGMLAAARDMADKEYTQTRGIYTPDSLAERVVAVMARHLIPTTGEKP